MLIANYQPLITKGGVKGEKGGGNSLHPGPYWDDLSAILVQRGGRMVISGVGRVRCPTDRYRPEGKPK